MRNPDGTFMKGVSGNPAGRPKNFRAYLFERLAEKNQNKIESGVNWLFELVDNKDFAALRVMLEYFGCKARPDDGEPEPQEPPKIAVGEQDDALELYILGKQGKAKLVEENGKKIVVMVEDENEPKQDD